MHHDLQRGRPLEIRWLSGGVVQLGNAVGVATPLNRAIADVLAPCEAGAPAASRPKASRCEVTGELLALT
jgi:2-dehydropantoate 2-reductase